MEIVLGKTAGFCFGVKRSVEEAKKYIQAKGKTDCLGELIHNEEALAMLKEHGMRVIENIEEANQRVIFRAHGIEKEIYEKAKQMGVEVMDLTCPKVLKIHQMAEEYARDGKFVILIGEKQHPEVIATYSFCGENKAILEEKEDIPEVIEKILGSGIHKIELISQTTFHMQKFDELVEELKNNLQENLELNVHKTICEATKTRQEETEKIAKEVDVMIIIGGKKSANTNKLVEIAKMHCKEVQFIQTKDNLLLDQLKGKEKIGIMAGASTLEEKIQEVKEILESL